MQQWTLPGKSVKRNSIHHIFHGREKIMQRMCLIGKKCPGSHVLHATILERVKMEFEEGDLLVRLLSGFSPAPFNFALNELLQSHF